MNNICGHTDRSKPFYSCQLVRLAFRLDQSKWVVLVASLSIGEVLSRLGTVTRPGYSIHRLHPPLPPSRALNAPSSSLHACAPSSACWDLSTFSSQRTGPPLSRLLTHHWKPTATPSARQHRRTNHSTTCTSGSTHGCCSRIFPLLCPSMLTFTSIIRNI